MDSSSKNRDACGQAFDEGQRAGKTKEAEGAKEASGVEGAGQAEGAEELVVPLRLQKFLARAGVASRRGSENLMTAGRVRVNGEVACELGTKVDPLKDEVAVDGKVVSYSNRPVTLMLNKPPGYITTMTDPYGRPCVASLVPLDTYPGLYPLGRLDADTTGLLLFSTDGELGFRLLHPRYHVVKSYEVEAAGRVSAQSLARLRQGIELEDGMTLPAAVDVLSLGDASSRMNISISEGRNRQIRRMFDAIGNPVISLNRFAFGPIALGGLEQGQWRLLTPEERALLDEQE